MYKSLLSRDFRGFRASRIQDTDLKWTFVLNFTEDSIPQQLNENFWLSSRDYVFFFFFRPPSSFFCYCPMEGLLIASGYTRWFVIGGVEVERNIDRGVDTYIAPNSTGRTTDKLKLQDHSLVHDICEPQDSLIIVPRERGPQLTCISYKRIGETPSENKMNDRKSWCYHVTLYQRSLIISNSPLITALQPIPHPYSFSIAFLFFHFYSQSPFNTNILIKKIENVCHRLTSHVLKWSALFCRIEASS